MSRQLTLLHLNKAVQDLVASDKLSAAHGAELAAVPHAQQQQLADKVIRFEWSQCQLREAIRKKKPKDSRGGKEKIDPDIHALNMRLSDLLGTPVEVKHGSKGKGYVRIEYANLDILQGLLDKLENKVQKTKSKSKNN